MGKESNQSAILIYVCVILIWAEARASLEIAHKELVLGSCANKEKRVKGMKDKLNIYVKKNLNFQIIEK